MADAKVTPEMVEAMLAARKAGASIRKVAADAGVSVSVAHRHLARAEAAEAERRSGGATRGRSAPAPEPVELEPDAPLNVRRELELIARTSSSQIARIQALRELTKLDREVPAEGDPSGYYLPDGTRCILPDGREVLIVDHRDREGQYVVSSRRPEPGSTRSAGSVSAELTE
jgi:hypothetical protein